MGLDDGVDRAKRAAGERAAEEVTEGMVVGLGTGSTAGYAIRAVGRKVDAGLDVTGVPTSYGARAVAREAGIPLAALCDVGRLDLAIDGADQVAGSTVVKGGGGAHAREKVVAAAADRFVVVVDDSKVADRIDHPVPVEVLPAAESFVTRRVEATGATVERREGSGKAGPVVTDNGNLVLDCAYGVLRDPGEVAGTLSGVPGVVEHGLFIGLVDGVYVGSDSGVELRETNAGL